MSKNVVLIIGATGTVGPHAASRLVAAGATVRVLALKDDPNLDRLPPQAEILFGDLAEPDSLDEALDGVDGVFLMWPFFTLDVSTAPAVLSKIEAAARRVVFVSSVGVHIGLEPVDNNCHAYIEKLLEQTTLEWTFLRTTGFHCNALGFAPQIRGGDMVRYPHGRATRTSVDEADVAAVGVTALTGSGHARAKYLVSGPEELSQQQQVDIIGAALGRKIRWEDIEQEDAKRAMVGSGWPPTYAQGALDYFAMLVEQPEVSATTVQDVTGRPARSFAAWTAEHLDTFR